ncbi:MAG TPA: hypothetical protein VKA68_07130 [bacterium]|nr:hypothetical protein [bacterium]
MGLTLNVLREFATATSYQRGEEYYKRGAVRTLTREHDRFTATVRGTDQYKVTIMAESEDSLQFSCTCPYDWGGICKHAVAAGLAIIAGEYRDTPTLQESDQHVPELPPQQFLEEIYQDVDPEVREAFLQQLLTKHTELRQQFYAFIQGPPEKPLTDRINSIRDSFSDELQGFAYDEIDFRTYNQGMYQRYISEWELYRESAEDQISGVFEKYFSRAISHLCQGQAADGFAVVLGVYEGFQPLTMPGHDPYNIVSDDYHPLLRSMFTASMDTFAEALSEAVIAPNAARQCLQPLLDRAKFYLSIEPEDMEDDVYYQFTLFAEVIEILIQEQETAIWLDERLREHQLSDPGLGPVLLKIAEITGDKERWHREAHTYADHDPDIAAELLDTYHAQEATDEFYRTARQAFARWPDRFDTYLLDRIDPAHDPAFYRKVVAHLADSTQDIRYYRLLRDHIPEQECWVFIRKFKPFPEFYVELLTEEAAYEEILHYVRTHQADYAFPHLVRPILKEYPDECFQLIKAKTDRVLQDKRGRRVYRQVVSWLREMQRIPGREEAATRYFREVYNHKPVLPALRDEMEKAGLT